MALAFVFGGPIQTVGDLMDAVTEAKEIVATVNIGDHYISVPVTKKSIRDAYKDDSDPDGWLDEQGRYEPQFDHDTKTLYLG